MINNSYQQQQIERGEGAAPVEKKNFFQTLFPISGSNSTQALQAPRNVIQITSARDYLNAMKNWPGLMVIMYKLPHCPACIQAYPRFVEMVSEYPQVKFATVTLGAGKPMMPSSLEFPRAVPTFIGIRGRIVSFNVTGFNPESLRSLIISYK
jgi:hypothetical protein